MMSILNTRLIAALMSLVIVTAFPGCVYLAVGAAGVVGGYVVSPDTVEGTVAHSVDECWDGAKEIIGIMGKIMQESPNGSELTANINGSTVTVALSAISVSSTRVNVKARKVFMPKIDVAQDVYAKIVSRMDN